MLSAHPDDEVLTPPPTGQRCESVRGTGRVLWQPLPPNRYKSAPKNTSEARGQEPNVPNQSRDLSMGLGLRSVSPGD